MAPGRLSAVSSGCDGATDRGRGRCVAEEMFDQVLVRPKPSRRKTLLIVATAAGHAAVISALVLVAFWKIEPLPLQERQVSVAVRLEAEPPGGPPPGQKIDVIKKAEKPIKVVPKDPVQPTIAKDPEPPKTDPGGAASTVPGGGGDNPDGDPRSTLTGTGTCFEEPCGPEVAQPKKDPPKVTVDPCVADPNAPGCRPAMVTPTVAAGLRIAGNEKIYPPDTVKLAMQRDGTSAVNATVKICIDKGGAIDEVRLMKKTGYADYDRELEQQIRRWKYRPYQVNGVETTMCTAIQINYRMSR